MTLPSAIAPSLADQVAAVLEQMPDPSGGAATGQLEQELAQAFGVPRAVAVASGTAALHAALSACGIGPGDAVLVSALTVVMTVAPVVAVGATPVFVDSDPATLDLDYHDAARKITPQTQAIVPVHLWGRMGDPAALSAFASGHGLTIIEDAAQAAGSSRCGRKAGTIGAVGCFSMKDGRSCGAARAASCSRPTVSWPSTRRRSAATGSSHRPAKPRRAAWGPTPG